GGAMSRSVGVLCAGLLLLAAAGCAVDEFFVNLTGSPDRKEITVPISLEQASLTLHAWTRNTFQIQLTDSRDGEELHLAGQTATGNKFEFILQRQSAGNGAESTVI